MAVFLAAPELAAQSYQQLYDDGRFLDAAIAAQDEGSADSLVMAAQAHLVIARFYAAEDYRDVHIQAAIDATNEALIKKPNLGEAYFQLGAAWGLRARYEKSVSDAKISRDFLRQALKHAPESARIQAGLGGWNGEAVARAGGLMARLILGAKRSRMEELFARAMTLEPENLSVLSGHATTLLRLGKDDDVLLARQLLETISRANADTAMERIVQDYTGKLLRALNDGDEKQLENLLEHYRAPDYE